MTEADTERLTAQRCFHHPQREAVARCLECQRFFCRECVTEHDARMICALCLARLADAASAGRAARQGVADLVKVGFAFLALWLVFYVLGQGLLRLPSAFHEGHLWEAGTAFREE